MNADAVIALIQEEYELAVKRYGRGSGVARALARILDKIKEAQNATL